MSPGKQPAEGEAAVPTVAGARLEMMRRRVRLSRLAVWTAIAAGPVALAVAVTSGPTTVEAAAPPTPTTVRSTTDTTAGTPAAGFAQVFVGAWVRSSADASTSAQARLAQSMGPDVELPDPAASAQPVPQLVTAVRSAHRSGRAWSVTVAAQYATGLVRYYVVPVVADRAGTGFAVTGAPGVVAGPAKAVVPASSYTVTVSQGDLVSAVGEFLAAYLTGSGEVDRYLAPGVSLSAVSPAPYTSVTVPRVSAVEDVATAEKVPSDGTGVRVLAEVEARDAGGRWPLAYEVTLKARSGRWEITGLESGTSDGGAR